MNTLLGYSAKDRGFEVVYDYGTPSNPGSKLVDMSEAKLVVRDPGNQSVMDAIRAYIEYRSGVVLQQRGYAFYPLNSNLIVELEGMEFIVRRRLACEQKEYEKLCPDQGHV